jgi:hypothetical protein
MVDLVRRVIRRDLVGGEFRKMTRLDRLVLKLLSIFFLIIQVHISYHSGGTAGAFASAGLILQFGNNYSFMFSPPLFAVAGGLWLCITLDISNGQVMVVDEDSHYFRVCSITTVPNLGRL